MPNNQQDEPTNDVQEVTEVTEVTLFNDLLDDETLVDMTAAEGAELDLDHPLAFGWQETLKSFYGDAENPLSQITASSAMKFLAMPMLLGSKSAAKAVQDAAHDHLKQLPANLTELSASATLVVEESTKPKNPPSKWANLRDRQSKLNLAQASVMGARINPKVLGRLSVGSNAMVLFAHGLQAAISEETLVSAGVEDVDIIDLFYEFSKQVKANKWVSEKDLDRLANKLSGMFGPKWNDVITTVGKLTSIVNTQKLLEGAGNYQTNDIVAEAGALRTLIPAIAEHQGDEFSSGFGVSIARGAIQMQNAMITLLKREDVQKGCHVYTGNPDEGVLKFFRKYVNKHAQAVYRLAMVTENLVFAIGQCPATAAQVDNEYLNIVGDLALQWKVLNGMVQEEQKDGKETMAASTADSFQPTVQKPTLQTRYKFSLSFGFVKVG